MYYDAGVMSDGKRESDLPGMQAFLLVALVGMVVVFFAWDVRDAMGSSGWLLMGLGVLFVVSGLFATGWTLKLAKLRRTPALPAAPAEYKGVFAPDFRRNLAALHASLPVENSEMVLEEDYAFWYNHEHSLELVLTPEGWMAFFVLMGGDCSAAAEVVQRAVADSPFSQHPVAQELSGKYSDMPLSGVAWCVGERLVVYPYDITEDFTRHYAGNLFAPAGAFDAWLKYYLETGEMLEDEEH